jgi:hypothetical protein
LYGLTLPAAEVLRAARACQAHASELVLALIAGALGQAHPAPVPPRMRAMFAVTRDPRRRAPTQGNWTGAVTLDLPLGRGSPRARVSTVRDVLRTALGSGQAEAAGLVMRAVGVLPAPLHAAFARRVYTDRHLNVIVSYVPAPFQRQLAGAPIRAVTPVVALADGVPVGVGVLRYGATFEVGVLLDDSLAGFGDRLTTALPTALADLLAEVDGEQLDLDEPVDADRAVRAVVGKDAGLRRAGAAPPESPRCG